MARAGSYKLGDLVHKWPANLRGVQKCTAAVATLDGALSAYDCETVPRVQFTVEGGSGN